MHSQTNGVNRADEYNRRGLNLRVCLRVNLALKMATNLSFKSNLKFTGHDFIIRQKGMQPFANRSASCERDHFEGLFTGARFAGPARLNEAPGFIVISY